jgi:uncharacterized protein (DUF1499 family)
MWKVVAALVVLIAAGLAWIRLAPSDPLRWNADPRAASAGHQGFLVRPLDGDVESQVYTIPPERLLEIVTDIAAAWPRTLLLAREGLRATWITRTKILGFPDYTTVEAVADPDGSRLIVYARQRFGLGDMGVNEARVRRWLKTLNEVVLKTQQSTQGSG